MNWTSPFIYLFVCFHRALNLFDMSVALLFIIIICGIITMELNKVV